MTLHRVPGARTLQLPAYFDHALPLLLLSQVECGVGSPAKAKRKGPPWLADLRPVTAIHSHHPTGSPGSHSLALRRAQHLPLWLLKLPRQKAQILTPGQKYRGIAATAGLVRSGR